MMQDFPVMLTVHTLRYPSMLPLLARINDCLARKDRICIAIDGMCGSGKTSLADRLAALYHAPVIHTDDFYLPPELRTEQRQRQGNVHYERLIPEVLLPLREGGPFDYRVYSCRTGRYTKTVHVAPAAVTLVEGSYSSHPDLEDFYDLRVFLETAPDEQRRRIRKRNGAAAWERFRQQWIPLENAYFQTFRIRERADWIGRT